jgi:opacity protein-like surface antigen
MKKPVKTAALLLMLGAHGASAQPLVSGHSYLSLGYATADLELIDKGSTTGVSAKYLFEPRGSKVGFAGSVTYTTGDEAITQPMGPSATLNLDYLSVSVGPSYQLTDYLAAYGLLGFAIGDADVNGGPGVHDITLAYGVGVQIRPPGNLFLDVSYEGAGVGRGTQYLDGDTISMGLGYRF